MNIKIWHKLAFLLILTTSLTIAIGVGLSQLSFKNSFLKYQQNQMLRRFNHLSDELLIAYREHGNWEFLRNNRRLWHFYLRSSINNEGIRVPEYLSPALSEDKKHKRNDKNDHFPFLPPGAGRRRLIKHMVLLDEHKEIIVGDAFFSSNKQYFPLKLDNNIIAYIESEKNFRIIDRLDQIFERQQNQSFLMNTMAAFLISLIVALLASFYLRKRINTLTFIAHQLTSGKYEHQIEVKEKDELGQLGMDFNMLSKTLQKNQQSQRQWIADISHELRTPIAVLKGELEALDDGIRPLNSKAIHSLQQETKRLGKLVDDLYQLSVSDMGALRYEKTDFIIYDLLTEIHESFQARFLKQNIKFTLKENHSKSLVFHGDQQRLSQLFCNLLENSLNYTDAGGETRICISNNEQQLFIRIEDSAPGIPEEKLAYIFKRLFRIDSSRNRAKGGAGLGLSICKQIVIAHQGEISAQASELGGVSMNCVFPL